MKYKHITTAFLLSSIFYFLSPVQAQAAMVVGSGDVSNNLKIGLVHWWTFDGVDTTDIVAFNKAGTYNGTMAYTTKVPGISGQALRFNTTSSGVNVGSIPTYGGNYTISAWIRVPTRTTAENVIFGSYASENGRQLIYNADGIAGRIKFQEIDTGGPSSAVYTAPQLGDNKWHQIAIIVRNETNYELYGDGRLLSSTSVISRNPTAQNAYIGRYNQLPGYFGGDIDDVRIYNRALSANEVYSLYKYGSSKIVQNETPRDKLTNGLVGWWTFDGTDCGATWCIDKSGNGKTATINGGMVKAGGRMGQGLSFDGVDDYVDLGDNFGMTTSPAIFTISTWLRRPANTTFPIIGKSNTSSVLSGWGITRTTTGISFSMRDRGDPCGAGGTLYGFAGAPTASYSGNWEHIVATFDANISDTNERLKIFLNGKRLTFTPTEPPANPAASKAGANTNNMKMGAYTTGTECQFPGPIIGFSKGMLDDVRIYSRALSGNEVYSLYQYGNSKVLQNESPLKKLTNNLAGYWTFDGPDCGSTYCVDKSGSGNTGTLTGTKKTIGKIGQALTFNGTSDVVSATVSSPSAVAYWYKTDAGNWTFNASSTSGSMTTTYVNGQAAALATNPVYIAGTSVSIGKTDVSTYFSGKIDDVRVYNNPLSANEIYSLYKYGR